MARASIAARYTSGRGIVKGFRLIVGLVIMASLGSVLSDPGALAKKSLQLPTGARALAVLDRGRIATLQEGSLSVLDGDSGARLGGPFRLQSDAEVIVG